MTEFISSPGTGEIYSDADPAVFLRPISLQDDAQRYFDLIDHDRAHFYPWARETPIKYQTVKDVEARFAQLEPNEHYFGIWDREINEIVGSTHLVVGDLKNKPPNDDPTSAEIGSWIGGEFARHHYAARAKQLVFYFAFQQLGLKRVFADIINGNDRSVKSARLAGMSFEGVKASGTYLTYAITREQWEEKQRRGGIEV